MTTEKETPTTVENSTSRDIIITFNVIIQFLTQPIPVTVDEWLNHSYRQSEIFTFVCSNNDFLVI